jgi:dTDP-4-dehydrorhamnose reductase
VGSRAVVRLRGHHDVHGAFNRHRPTFLGHPDDRLIQVDVRDLVAVRESLDRVAPEVVIHAAARTDVDGCEADPEGAHAANVAPVRELAAWGRRTGGRVVLLSTDYVFDGTSPPYEVDAPRRPLCVYSRTKAQAEEAVHGVEGCLVARSTVIYGKDFGHQKRNFATWLVGELQAGRPVRVVDDQWNTPTIAENLADMLDRAVERGLEGVVHMAPEECLPRDEFARRIARRFGLREDLITPVPTAALDQPARRPLRPCMSMVRSSKLLGMQPWTIARSLDLLHLQAQDAGRSSLKPWW